MALPKFGLPSPVRVCADCFNDLSRLKKDDEPSVSNGIGAVADSITRLDFDSTLETKSEPTVKPVSTQGVLECKCGMPLCICEAPALPKDPVPGPSTSPNATYIRANPKPKRSENLPRSRGSTSSSKHGTIFNSGQATNETLAVDYEASGEGLREAIKNGDSAVAKKLLNQGVDANYCDKQGSSLLHLAAVFNQTEIVFALMDHGARLDCKNSQGETPLDCAPVTLQYKMKKKIEEAEQLGSRSMES